MTGNAQTMNPVPNAYTGNAFGTPQQGFWGNQGGFGGGTPFGFGAQGFQQQQVPNLIGQTGAFTPQFNPQMGQQPGIFGQGQQIPQGQAGAVGNPQMALQGALQCCPPEVVNAIVQTCPPQVLPYVLNALACQQVCQQVLAQNPQAVQGINPQAITQPFLTQGQTGQGQFGFGSAGGIGINRTPFQGGFQQQGVPQFQQQGVPQFPQQASMLGAIPGTQQGLPGMGFQGGQGQVQPQQPWGGSPYGTW